MKKLILPMIVVIASLSLMSFRSTKSYDQELVDLKNYTFDHKLMNSYVLASKADPNSAADQAKYCSVFKWAWRNSCTSLAFEVATYFASGNKLTRDKVTELESVGILKKL